MDATTTSDNRHEILAKLKKLALDMRWAWNHAADRLWHEIDPVLWEETHNPWYLLQTISEEKIIEKLHDPALLEIVNKLIEHHYHDTLDQTWFQKKYKATHLKKIAFFSMEYMLSEALPIYSGGLGNVAGDMLKTASDLGIPFVGIGLLYQQGYFRQVIDEDGSQRAFYPTNNFWQLPITPLRDEKGDWVRFNLDVPHLPILLRIWQVRIGRLHLYLLDTNDTANYPPYRNITGELYNIDKTTRLLQELVLGIGGYQLLKKLDITPDICHLNEGHTAFVVLERARDFMVKSGQSFEIAFQATRAGNLFTTHTAVPAGFDLYDQELIERYLKTYAEKQLGISLQEFLALGRSNTNGWGEPFNMAYLAIRGSGAVNGVSKLHGEVSRSLFHSLFAGWSTSEVPIGYITNGVHMPSWDSIKADKLWTKACGKDRWLTVDTDISHQIAEITDNEIWQFRLASTKTLIEFVRKRIARTRRIAGRTLEAIHEAQHLFNPSAFTIGFTRRFTAYKRPDLLLYDPERLSKILMNPVFPVQLIVAGKAHPADDIGQQLIRKWTAFATRPEVHSHVVFLADHDMRLAERLVQGVDLWINTPQRPWEACGTSGMKILVNGGINLSELDGWWAEAYTPEVGFAIGDGKTHEDQAAYDRKEAATLYDILEHQIIPEFYSRDKDDIPRNWVQRVRASMSQLTPVYSTNRAMKQYIEQYYLPLAENYLKRCKNNGDYGAQMVNFKHAIEKNWSTMHFGKMSIVRLEQNDYEVQIEVYLGAIQHEDINVQIYAPATTASASEIYTISTFKLEPHGLSRYQMTITTNRDSKDFAARIIPNYAYLSVPLEEDHILWLEQE